MRKIFFNPKTLEIKGMSDGENSLDFPYVEVEEDYHSYENLTVEKKGEEYQLKIIKGYL